MRRENLEREGERGKGKSGAIRENQNERGKAKLMSNQHYRGASHRLDKSTTSFFVSNFSKSANMGVLWQIFARFGNVGEVFIPNKVDKWGKRFAFVKFREVRDVEELEGRMQEVMCGEEVLKVNLARFGREEGGKGPVMGVRRGEFPRANVVAGRSFREALTREVPQVVVKEKSSTPALVVHPTEEMLQFLSTGFVAHLHHPREVSRIQAAVFMEGWSGIKVFAMGEGVVLLHSDREGEIERARAEKKEWWANNFLYVQKWLPHLIGKKRRTWVKLYGVPLHVWDESFFKIFAGKIGVFIDFDSDTADKKRFDVARLLISTYRWGFIDDWVKVEVMGARYDIKVVEDISYSGIEEVEEEIFLEQGSLPEVDGGKTGLMAYRKVVLKTGPTRRRWEGVKKMKLSMGPSSWMTWLLLAWGTSWEMGIYNFWGYRELVTCWGIAFLINQ